MDDFGQLGFALQVLFAFGGGIIAFLSPCVLPLVPGYLGLMSGYSIADIQSGAVGKGRMLRVTSLFVLGFTLVFVAFGATATQISRFLLSNQSLAGRIAGVLVIGFAIVMIGSSFTTRGVFGFMAQERRFEVRPSRLGAWAPPLMGMAFGFGWSACIGPILGGVLGIAATRETVGQGMLLLFVFGMGLGIPFILTGLGLSKAMTRMASFRKWMRPVNVASGVLMLGFGVLLLTGNVTRLSSLLVDVFLNVPLLEELASI